MKSQIRIGVILGMMSLATMWTVAQENGPLTDSNVDREVTKENAEPVIQAIMDSAHFYQQNKFPAKSLLFLLEAQEMQHLLEDTSDIVLQMHSQFATTLSDLEDKLDAISHLNQALDILSKKKENKILDLYLENGRKGSFLMHVGLMDSANAVFARGLEMAERMNRPLYISAAHNNIGIAMARQGNSDSAIVCYVTAMEFLRKAPPTDELTGLRTSIQDNLALLAEERGDFPEALTLHKINFQSTYKHPKHNGRAIKSGLGAASLLIYFDRFEESEKMLNELDTVFGGYRPEEVIEERRRYYELRYNWNADQGNRQEALFFARLMNETAAKLLSASDSKLQQTMSVLNQYKLDNVRNIRKLSDLRLSESENKLLIAEKTSFIRNLWIIFISIFSLLVIGFGLWYFRKKTSYDQMQKQLIELDLKNKELESEKLKSELESKKKDLTDFALDNTRKREWAQDLLNRLGELMSLPEGRREMAIRQLTLDMNNQLMVEERLQLFQENVDHVNQEFYNKLNDRFPRLTKSEKELCGLIRLNLSGKEIANIRNVEPRSVTKSKNRLRKKLELDPYDDLYEFLQGQ